METCRWCGARVLEGTKVCPDCGARLRRDSINCPQCKREMRVGLAICPYCGEELGRRRIPWKLIGSVGGFILAMVVIYALLNVLPLPVNLPFVAAAPSPTPTEVMLPPTATPTHTPWPPTATPTATATFTPVITATITEVVTATPVGSRVPTETPIVTPTEASGLKYPPPQLIGPEDESGLSPDTPPDFSSGSVVQLTWQSVGTLAEDEWYSVSMTYVDRDGEPAERVRWTKDNVWSIGQDLRDLLGEERAVRWNVTVVADPTGSGEGAPISPPSDTWMFRWG